MTIAIFTRGPVLRHILVMTSANTISLLALVASDLVDMYFLSRLGQQELAAAIGFAGILLFFLVSVGLGLQIAMAALVAQAEGRHDRPLAKRLCTHVLVASVVVTTLVTIPVWFTLEPLLKLLGAEGETLVLAVRYCAIVLPTVPILMCGMCVAAALRALGDARRSMFATLAAALVTVVLDPVLILGLDMGIRGAAVAALVARLALAGIGLWVLVGRYGFLCRLRWPALRADLLPIYRIAGPAILTTLATPIGSSYVVRSMAGYGETAVAGAAVLGRVIPVAFAAIFALTGAIGPIIGQNAHAGRFDRVRQALLIAVGLSAGYVLFVWLLLYPLQGRVVALFGTTGVGAELIHFYCTWLVGAFVFAGILIIALTAFNNLNLAMVATRFNVARVALGLFPLVTLGGSLWGAPGVMLGEAAAMVLWGTLAFIALWRRVAIMAEQHTPVITPPAAVDDLASMAYSSGVSQLGRGQSIVLDDMSCTDIQNPDTAGPVVAEK